MAPVAGLFYSDTLASGALLGAFLVIQTIKNLPAMWDTQV